MSYVVWANHHFYYPYKDITAYLRIDSSESFIIGWTLDKNEASHFSSFNDANQWYKDILEEQSDKQSRIVFDIVLGIGKV